MRQAAEVVARGDPVSSCRPARSHLVLPQEASVARSRLGRKLRTGMGCGLGGAQGAGRGPRRGCRRLPSSRSWSPRPCVDGAGSLSVGGMGTLPPTRPGSRCCTYSEVPGSPFQDAAQEAAVQEDVLALGGGKGGGRLRDRGPAGRLPGPDQPDGPGQGRGFGEPSRGAPPHQSWQGPSYLPPPAQRETEAPIGG